MVLMEKPVNKYIETYINNYVRPFRVFVTTKYTVNIGGLADFIVADEHDVLFLLHELQKYDFDVTISKGHDTIDEIQVTYTCEESIKSKVFEYKIENLISTTFLSSKTNISIVGILVMQIISRIICKTRTMYKALILDIDDTLWKGTLAEEGFYAIKQVLNSKDALPFTTFMRFIQVMAKELGLYVAVCSRNDNEMILSAIDKLSEKEFPLKGHIDCIVANYNDKSKNIKAIAKKLSILTNACVFIDDNPLIRDEVRKNLPEVFVPDWENHDELITLLITCCVFDRGELSLKSRNRKRLYEVLQQERERSCLPQLFVKVSEDPGHIEAMHLYAKSNQFKFIEKRESYDGCKSIVFEIFRDNGENLGICSAMTYNGDIQNLHILNWAISCRYFEIGLEEYILLYISSLSDKQPINFTFKDTGVNGKSVALIEKYRTYFIKNLDNEEIRFIPNIQAINELLLNTKLKNYCNE